MAYSHLTQTVLDAFNALADEVQVLADRKTILEHKLRFAHEQFQYLADKYAPAAPEIAETLAKLQLPVHTSSVDDTSPVPLPKRASLHSQHQIALIIRDGRRAASKLASLGEASKTTVSTRDTMSHTSLVETSLSTALEQDFTVEGKKGNLQCPFSKDGAANAPAHVGAHPENLRELDPPASEDPICAAMYQESASVNGAQASKCPIRFIDKHSPEEIAHYVETHKHELPRSHEVCLRRYQRNEEQIKKLDSKYGNIVSMIEDLSQLHKPMLPEDEQVRRPSYATGASDDRVANWAQDVHVNTAPDAALEAPTEADDDHDRQSRFDRPLKEVRVGESPGRPWGISVPVYDPSGNDAGHSMSPPPAPVRMLSPTQDTRIPISSSSPKKCPFGHHSALSGLNPHTEKEMNENPASRTVEEPSSLLGSAKEPVPHVSHTPLQPAFINPEVSKAAPGVPQMIFTGPVFIGYPMEQAIQFMNQYQRNK